MDPERKENTLDRENSRIEMMVEFALGETCVDARERGEGVDYFLARFIVMM